MQSCSDGVAHFELHFVAMESSGRVEAMVIRARGELTAKDSKG